MNQFEMLGSMISISLKSGNFLRYSFENGQYEVSRKRDNYDLVTEVDIKSQKIIQEELAEKFPGVLIIGEEDKKITKGENAFFVDPLDGTLNFVKGIPFFSVSIGYWEKNKPVCGVVYDPIRQDLFYARKGQGSYLNGQKLYLPQKDKRSNPLFASDWGHDPGLYQKNVDVMQQLMNDYSCLFRYMGCASLAISYVGAGIFDGYWHFKLLPWDMAAAVLIAEEAGADASLINGSPYHLWDQSILVVRPPLKDTLVSSVKKVEEI